MRRSEKLKEVRVGEYDDRTVPVERSAARKWLQRAAPRLLIGFIGAALLIGSILGGWLASSYFRISQTRAAAEAVRAELLENRNRLDRQASIAESAANDALDGSLEGMGDRIDRLSAEFRASVWRLAGSRMDMRDPETIRTAALYDRLEALPLQYQRVYSALDRWRAESGREVLNTELKTEAQRALRRLAGDLRSLQRDADALLADDSF